MEQSTFGSLAVRVESSNEALGTAAAERFAAAVRTELDSHAETSVILATGNSQLSFIRAVRDRPDIEWDRITVFHMDEYLGMGEGHPASFRRWMRENLVDHVTPKDFFEIRGDFDPIHEEVARYGELLTRLDPSICVMGIGENGHLAFNDPPADFDTTDPIKVVGLDVECRQQQVGEGHFGSIEEVPTRALTLTVFALLRPRTVLVLTPEARKAQAVRRALLGPVTPECPASILQRASNAFLYLDPESASFLND